MTKRETRAVNRREFMQRTVSSAAAGAAVVSSTVVMAQPTETPALLGGSPVRKREWPSWPVTNEREETAILEVLRSGAWYRYRAGEDGHVAKFEQLWAETIGTNYCQATANGTSALVNSLAALGIGPGDEVLVPVYTFIATINSVLLLHALPVFVDSDPDTAQMDADAIPERINRNTKAMIPVHLGGAPCHMGKIMTIARKRGIKVIEDACQAHTGCWKGQRVGSIGDAGCFSFQNSKNITSGEGGAVTTSDQQLHARAQAFHNNGIGSLGDDGGYTANGGNFRLTEFQAAILRQQHERLEHQSHHREKTGAYLAQLLEGVSGVRAKTVYPGTTRHGYHLFVFDYDLSVCQSLTRESTTETRRLSAASVVNSKRISYFLTVPNGMQRSSVDDPRWLRATCNEAIHFSRLNLCSQPDIDAIFFQGSDK